MTVSLAMRVAALYLQTGQTSHAYGPEDEMSLVQRVAREHRANMFNEGDEVLFGKYKNKRGKILRMFTDERGVPMVEIQPIPQGRKKNRQMGLYNIWHLPERRLQEKTACIIAGRKFNDHLCLLKNRDRSYDAKLQVMHLEVGSTEIALVIDLTTGYVEGVNEHGIAVVNTTLLTVRDEAEGTTQDGHQKTVKSREGPQIFRALLERDIEKAIESLVTYSGGIRGHTFVSDGKRLACIECTKLYPAKVHEMDPNRINTRTNHGVAYPEAGYTKGDDYVSSIVRRWEAQKRLQSVKNMEAVAPALVKLVEDVDEAYNPVRVTDKMRTTSQLLIDTTTPSLYLYLIPGHVSLEPTLNLLPGGRAPKIPVRVFQYKKTMEDRDIKAMQREVVARYKSKKTVKTKDGEDMVVYEYGPRQVANRNKAKAERVERLRTSIHALRKKVRRDLTVKEDKTRAIALAIALMDETFERIGNEGSAAEGHFGVTTWQVSHVRFRNGKATISYVGKSGVKHKKEVSTPAIVKALKAACKDKKGNACVIDVSASDVNEYLSPFEITAKDIRGFHANREMSDRLKAIRKEGPKLPEDKKEREKLLKEEFKEALKATSEAVGHTESTLKSQYLVPGLEDDYLKDGTVSTSLVKKASPGSNLLLAAKTFIEKRYLASARQAPTFLAQSRQWWLTHAPNIYRIAREFEKPKPFIEGMVFSPEIFSTLWYENEEGDRLPHEEGDVPSGAATQHTQWPNELRHTILFQNEDGTASSFGGGSTYSSDLLTSMIRSGEWDAADAIQVAGQACERCSNVLHHRYNTGDGYPFGSKEYLKCRTCCPLCLPVMGDPHVEPTSRAVKIATPRYEDYVQEKRTQGESPLPRDQWETHVFGAPQEATAPSKEDWESLRQQLVTKHGLDKFHVSYHPEEKHLAVDNITVPVANRGSGNGGRAMAETLAWADQHGITVSLTPSSDFGSSKKKLEAWYRSLGFIPNKGRSKDFRFRDTMLRAPRPPKRATRSPAEVEDDQVEKMLRKEPKKKPPRYDLRDNRTLEDKDTGFASASNDPDLDMREGKIARRVAFQWLALPTKPSAARLILFRQAKDQEESEFRKYVDGKEFRNPNSDPKAKRTIAYDSLPPDEQKRIYDSWARSRTPDMTEEVEEVPEDEESEGGDLDSEIEDLSSDLEEAEETLEELDADLEEDPESSDENSESSEEPQETEEKDPSDDGEEEDPGSASDDLTGDLDPGSLLDLLEEEEEPEPSPEGVTNLSRSPSSEESEEGSEEEDIEELSPEDVTEDEPPAETSEDTAPKDAPAETPKGKTPSKKKPVRPLEEIERDVESARDKADDLQSSIAKLHATVKEAKSAIKALAKLEETASEGNKVKIREKIEEEKQTLRSAEKEIESKRAELKKTQQEVIALKKEQKGPSKQQLDREERDRKLEHKQRIEKTIKETESALHALSGSGLPKEVKQQIEGAVEALNEQQVEEFATSFQDRMQSLIEADPSSEDSINLANQAARVGDFNPSGSPQDLAHRLAEMAYARQVVANPMIVGGQRVGAQKMDDAAYGERAQAAFQQYQNLHPRLRQQAAAIIQGQLRNVEEGSDTEAELNAVLSGINTAHIAQTGEALPGRPQPTQGQTALVRKLIENGNADQMFRPMEDLFSDDSRSTISQALREMSDADIGSFITGDDKNHPYYELGRALNNPGGSEFKQLIKDYLIQDFLNDTWGDRAIRDVMQAAGAEGADNPQVRARILGESKTQNGTLRPALAAMERVNAAKARGEEPSAEDQELVRQVFDGEGSVGLRGNAKALLRTLGDKFDKYVVSPALAVVSHFVSSGDSSVFSQAILPHPEEGPMSVEQEDSSQDEDHGPGDVWETEEGNWRAKNPKGSPHSFQQREQAETYAHGRQGPGQSKEDLQIPVEDRGPMRFASVASIWLDQLRVVHPDDPARPIHIFEAA